MIDGFYINCIGDNDKTRLHNYDDEFVIESTRCVNVNTWQIFQRIAGVIYSISPKGWENYDEENEFFALDFKNINASAQDSRFMKMREDADIAYIVPRKQTKELIEIFKQLLKVSPIHRIAVLFRLQGKEAEIFDGEVYEDEFLDLFQSGKLMSNVVYIVGDRPYYDNIKAVRLKSNSNYIFDEGVKHDFAHKETNTKNSLSMRGCKVTNMLDTDEGLSFVFDDGIQVLGDGYTKSCAMVRIANAWATDTKTTFYIQRTKPKHQFWINSNDSKRLEYMGLKRKFTGYSVEVDELKELFKRGHVLEIEQEFFAETGLILKGNVLNKSKRVCEFEIDVEAVEDMVVDFFYN